VNGWLVPDVDTEGSLYYVFDVCGQLIEAFLTVNYFATLGVDKNSFLLRMQ